MAESAISLQELVDRFRLSKEQLDVDISDEHLNTASKIIADHDILGPELGLTSAEMTAINRERSLELQRLEMLRRWKQKYAWKAKYSTLIEALLKCGKGESARNICKLLTQKTSSEQPSASALQSSSIPISALSHSNATKTDGSQSVFAGNLSPSPNPPTHSRKRKKRVSGRNTPEVMTSAEMYRKKQKVEESSTESNIGLEVLVKNQIADYKNKITHLNEELTTLKLQLQKEMLLRLHEDKERELLQEFKKIKGRQPTPPIGDYVESGGIKYNLKRNGVGGNTYEIMILVSVGNDFPADVHVQYRERDSALAKKAVQTHGQFPPIVTGLHEEAAADLMAVASLRLQDCSGDLVRLCLDVPGEQRSKEYYLKTIEEFFKGCKQPQAILYYLGHSEERTGNWCFIDGTISFQDIFALYRKFHPGKPFIIHSDCCYSGNWVRECAKTLDRLNILPCGHMARKEGILIKVYASCQPDQKATEPCYSVERVVVDENTTLTVSMAPNQSLNQTPSVSDSTRLMCCRGPNESCRAKETLKNLTWQDAVDRQIMLF